MIRTTRTSRMHETKAAGAPATVTGGRDDSKDVTEYEASFARVRLVRAWVAVAAAIVAVLSTCLTLVEHFAK